MWSGSSGTLSRGTLRILEVRKVQLGQPSRYEPSSSTQVILSRHLQSCMILGLGKARFCPVVAQLSNTTPVSAAPVSRGNSGFWSLVTTSRAGFPY